MISMSLDDLHRKYLDAVRRRTSSFTAICIRRRNASVWTTTTSSNFPCIFSSGTRTSKLKWQKRLEYIMIDEFQDIDELQYRLMKVLCGYHKNLFIVGDPDQTIYTWRGANVRYLLDFDKQFPGTRTIMMMENYRSTPQIISAVNSLIGKNQYRMKKDLVPTLPDGGRSCAITP
jgi:DNA helicase-2/ATP-dependent DNA helicase PcrA